MNSRDSRDDETKHGDPKQCASTAVPHADLREEPPIGVSTKVSLSTLNGEEACTVHFLFIWAPQVDDRIVGVRT